MGPTPVPSKAPADWTRSARVLSRSRAPTRTRDRTRSTPARWSWPPARPSASGSLTLNGGTLAGDISGGTVNGLVQAGGGPHTIAPGAGLSAGQYGTLNFNGGLTTNNYTTLAFNLGGPVYGGAYSGDLINMGNSVLTIGASTALSFGSPLPSASGDYRLFSGSNLGNAAVNNFLPLATSGSDTYTVSATAEAGYIDLIVASAATFSGSATWVSTGNMTWSSSSNWQDAGGNNGVPGTTAGRTTDIAAFSNSSSVATITLDVNPSLAALGFSGTNNFVISGSGTLTMNGGTAGSVIDVLGGTQSIASAVRIAGGNFFVNAVGNGLLALSGSVADDSGQRSLTLAGDGSGQLILGGTANSYTGGTYVRAGHPGRQQQRRDPRQYGPGHRRRRYVRLRPHGDRHGQCGGAEPRRLAGCAGARAWDDYVVVGRALECGDLSPLSISAEGLSSAVLARHENSSRRSGFPT